MTNKTGIYIHIPFCVKKCLYCDFCSVANHSLKGEYVNALIREIESKEGVECDSVFIGGGTPTVLGKDLIRIVESVRKYFKLDSDSEFTVEANPGTVDEQLLKNLRKSGVNRLSIGAQSFNDNELKALGRIHSSKEIFEAFEQARRAGFENINLDIMLSTPEQSLSSVKNTLSRVRELSPEHVSAYSLIIEEGTPFYDMELALPDEDEEREIYHYAVDFLNDMGLEQYEISNFARKGFESRHNIKYWTGAPYLGFGAAASSYFENVRFKNTSDIEAYIKGSGKEEQIYIDENERLNEKFMLGLRMNKGVKYDGEFPEKIARLKEEGLIEERDGFVMLTKKGFDLGNIVFMEFV